MKYLLIILILISCTRKNNSSTELSIIDTVSSINEVKPEIITHKVSSLSEALSYSDDSYLSTEIDYFSENRINDFVEYFEIPKENKFIELSFKNVDQDYSMSRLYHFDFTGDSIEDYIYTSNYGAEEKHTVLYEDKNNNYRFISFIWGSLAKIFKDQNDKCYSFLFISNYCCGSLIGDYAVYAPKIENDKLTYKEIKKYKVAYDLKSPDEIHEPIRFEVLNENYRLRSEPIITQNDTLLYNSIGKDIQSNILAEFIPGSKGTAIATKADSLRTWWFVIMDTSSQTTKSVFYQDKNAHKIGWMSSKYLKKINGL